MVFLALQGRNFAPINVKFGTRDIGNGPLVRFPMPNSAFVGAEVWEYSPKQSKFAILPINLPVSGVSFAQRLRVSA